MPPFSALLRDHPALGYLDCMSRYEQHLERYRQALGEDRVHVVLFDDLKAPSSGRVSQRTSPTWSDW
jgi:hypothetical protein